MADMNLAERIFSLGKVEITTEMMIRIVEQDIPEAAPQEVSKKIKIGFAVNA